MTGFRLPWKPRSMKCWDHCIFSAPIFWITYKFCEVQELKKKKIKLLVLQVDLDIASMDFLWTRVEIWTDGVVDCSAYLQGLYTWGNEVTYHPNLGTRLWVCWKKTGSWSGLIDVLDHCQLHKQKNFGNVFLMLHGVIKNTPTKGVIKWNFNVFYLKLQSNYLQMLKG